MLNLLQPTNLKNEIVILVPLKQSDFELLYEVASDPLIWEQHPNPDRYKLDVFKNFFQGAMESKGAFLIVDAATGKALGSSRFYDHHPDKKEIKIGYTFFSRACWGKSINKNVKSLMIEHALTFVEDIIFHVGASNIRSQIAMERIGATKIGTEEVAYFGEATRLNCVYQISKT
jgi:RimJ/RimL family protein N-acetyltransferase